MRSRFVRKCIVLASLISGTSALANENVMVVFDGSNSMWGQIDGTAKIEIARGVMDNLLGSWVDGRSVGLMAYGHRRRGDCGDIEVLVEPGQAARQTILERINTITPTGKTPLSDAVEQAAKALSYTDQPATVVLISDGLESCERDPCALADALEKGGVAFTAHVVGFGLGGDEDTRSLACIAENTGGEYITATNADELGAALSAVGTAVAEAVPEPEPAPEPEAPAVVVDAPDTAVGGSEITVTWEPTVAEADYINIVPLGTDADVFGSYVRIGKATDLTLPVPGEEGLYEVRYLYNQTKEVLGQDTIEVAKPEVALSAADTVETGATFKLSWTPTINKRDYVAIVPAGSDEGEFGNYQTVSNSSEADLRAPADPGLYELRYILNIDKRTVATRPIEVSDPQVTLQVPQTALTGADFDVSWAGTVNQQDYITIVPMGTDEGEYGDYILVRDDNKNALKAPAETGMYEVRYILREGSKTLARATIEITAPEVSVSGPETVLTGEKFNVSWTGAVDTNDYVTIVPAGTDEGQYGNYVVVRDNDAGTLTAPSDPGFYELRYILREGSKTLATASIEVGEPAVTLSGPETVLTGEKFEVSWTGAIDANDYVTIVPAGSDEGEYGNYVLVRDKGIGTLTAQADPGLYELRYILREGAKTLATASIEVLQPEVTITAPATVLAGSKFKVSWTGAVSPQDYINIVPVGTDEGQFGNYVLVRDDSSNDIQAPSETGLYEIRYLLREGSKTIATASLEVTEPEVSISAPAEVRAGEKLRISWTGAVSLSDYVTLVPVGTPDEKLGVYTQVREKTDYDVTAPEETGLYEVRYMLREGNRVLARQTVEVLAADAQLNTGAAIDAPDTGAPGATITVSWSVESDSADQRITLARGEQAIFTWISAQKISGDPPLEITLPDEPGVYEIRFLDVSNKEVLSRKVIQVQ